MYSYPMYQSERKYKDRLVVNINTQLVLTFPSRVVLYFLFTLVSVRMYIYTTYISIRTCKLEAGKAVWQRGYTKVV